MRASASMRPNCYFEIVAISGPFHTTSSMQSVDTCAVFLTNRLILQHFLHVKIQVFANWLTMYIVANPRCPLHRGKRYHQAHALWTGSAVATAQVQSQTCALAPLRSLGSRRPHRDGPGRPLAVAVDPIGQSQISSSTIAIARRKCIRSARG